MRTRNESPRTAYTRFFKQNPHLLKLAKAPYKEGGYIVLDSLTDLSDNPHPFVYWVVWECSWSDQYGFVESVNVRDIRRLVASTGKANNGGEWVSCENEKGWTTGTADKDGIWHAVPTLEEISSDWEKEHS